MKPIKFEYDKTNELKTLIEEVYFGENNNGRLPNRFNKHLTLKSDNLYYKILTGLEYRVKIKNEEIIDGSMEFTIKENDNSIDLIPTSMFCIKEKNKYIFY